MVHTNTNIDLNEKAKFDAFASDWWDPKGKFKTLHDINPIRLQYIEQHIALSGKKILDIGCGGGILTEAMARQGAFVTGLDISEAPLAIARQHCKQSKLDIQYVNDQVEQYADTHVHSYDVITCMEMLEHVPDPQSIVNACAELIKPGGQVFFSTINRTLPAYVLAVLCAEYLLNLLPVGTHDYSRFIRPSELASWCQQCGLSVKNIAGISYLPVIDHFSINKNPNVNYLMHTCSEK